jgi:hypothetical protein
MPICCTCALLSKNSVPALCAASRPCNEFVNGCGSVPMSKPINSNVPLAVREFQFCVQMMIFILLRLSYCLLNVIWLLVEIVVVLLAAPKLPVLSVRGGFRIEASGLLSQFRLES